MKLHLRHHSSCCFPTGRSVEKTFIPDHRLVARPPHRPRQQLVDVPLQVLIRGNPDGILHSSLLQRFVNLRLGESGIGSKHHFLAQRLLPLNLGQQQFFPTLGTVHVAGPQLRRQAIAFAVEQQQRVIASGLEVSVVGDLLLVAVYRGIGTVHVQHFPAVDIWWLPLIRSPVDRGQAGEVLILSQ
jgi:hypothetical protein